MPRDQHPLAPTIVPPVNPDENGWGFRGPATNSAPAVPVERLEAVYYEALSRSIRTMHGIWFTGAPFVIREYGPVFGRAASPRNARALLAIGASYGSSTAEDAVAIVEREASTPGLAEVLDAFAAYGPIGSKAVARRIVAEFVV